MTLVVEIAPADWGEACSISEADAIFVVQPRSGAGFARLVAAALAEEHAKRLPDRPNPALLPYFPAAGETIFGVLMASGAGFVCHCAAPIAVLRESVSTMRLDLDMPPKPAIVAVDPLRRFAVPRQPVAAAVPLAIQRSRRTA
ncbi:MAG: hypothetical protein IBJ15_00175 [Alphaproteobacteria bacterium]|nr:hypothetical protein [Alphaproteobacteria bacterium]